MFVLVETAVNTVVLNHVPARKAREVFIFWLEEIWLEQLKQNNSAVGGNSGQ